MHGGGRSHSALQNLPRQRAHSCMYRHNVSTSHKSKTQCPSLSTMPSPADDSCHSTYVREHMRFPTVATPRHSARRLCGHALRDDYVLECHTQQCFAERMTQQAHVTPLSVNNTHLSARLKPGMSCAVPSPVLSLLTAVQALDAWHSSFVSPVQETPTSP